MDFGEGVDEGVGEVVEDGGALFGDADAAFGVRAHGCVPVCGFEEDGQEGGAAERWM